MLQSISNRSRGSFYTFIIWQGACFQWITAEESRYKILFGTIGNVFPVYPQENSNKSDHSKGNINFRFLLSD